MHPITVLIPDGESKLAHFVIQCLARVPEIKIHILSSRAWVNTRFSRHIRSFTQIENNENAEAWSRLVLQHAEKLGADVILPVDQEAIRKLSACQTSHPSSTVGLLLPTQASFDTAADKWCLAEFMAAHGLPAPAAVLFDSEERLKQIASQLNFPALSKPRSGDGGNGIRFWDEKTALLDFLVKEPQSAHGTFIVQEYLEGFDIDCSVLCKDGQILAYTIQTTLLPSRSRFAPSRSIRFDRNNQVLEIVGKLMAELKWSGIAHIDLRYDEQEDSYKILEINPRYWASLLGSLTAGVNFPYLACLASLNMDFPMPEYRLHGYFSLGSYIRNLIGEFRRNAHQPNGFEIRWQDTNIKYLLDDPLPTLAMYMKLAFSHFTKNA